MLCGCLPFCRLFAHGAYGERLARQRIHHRRQTPASESGKVTKKPAAWERKREEAIKHCRWKARDITRKDAKQAGNVDVATVVLLNRTFSGNLAGIHEIAGKSSVVQGDSAMPCDAADSYKQLPDYTSDIRHPSSPAALLRQGLFHMCRMHEMHELHGGTHRTGRLHEERIPPESLWLDTPLEVSTGGRA